MTLSRRPFVKKTASGPRHRLISISKRFALNSETRDGTAGATGLNHLSVPQLSVPL